MNRVGNRELLVLLGERNEMMNMTSKDGFVGDFGADWRKESGQKRGCPTI